MSLAWTFTNEAGTELNIGDGITYVVMGMQGHGVPQLSLSPVDRHGHPGLVLQRAKLPARSVILDIIAVGTTVANLETNLTNLVKHLAGSYGRNQARFGTLKYTREGGQVRSLRCIVSGGIEIDTSRRNGALSTRVSPVFWAEHPNWYDPAEKSTTAVIGTGAAAAYPLTYPITYGLSALAGSAALAYGGSAESYSLKWTVPGPCVAPSLYSATVERQLRFPGLTVPTGLSLLVRMGWRPDGIVEPRATLVDPDLNETDVVGYMSSDSRFFRLEPGVTNTLEASQSNDAATVHTLAWYDEYLAV